MIVEWKKGRGEGNGEGVEGSEERECNEDTYSDYASADEETQKYMLEACSLGLM